MGRISGVRRGVIASALAVLAAALWAPAASAAPSPAFHLDDGLDWGETDDVNGDTPGIGDPVSVTLRAGNGIPGANGYTGGPVKKHAALAGNVTDLTGDFSATDDATTGASLPFAFPFAGVKYKKVQVSTNGFIGFGMPAIDYWDDSQNSDFRGPRSVVGNFYRGAFPYWADLDLDDCGSGPGTAKKVVPASKRAVAFVWEESYHCDAMRRNFEVVLFRDGRIRFDYMSETDPGGPNDAAIGISGATGKPSFEAFAVNTADVPSKSLLYRPRAVGTDKAPGGTESLVLPFGSKFVGADSSKACSLKRKPTAGRTGLAECDVPALRAGRSLTRTVTFLVPDAEPFVGSSQAPNLDLSGKFRTGGKTRRDADESTLQESGFDATTLDAILTYSGGGGPGVGDPLPFDASITTPAPKLLKPSATFRWPAGTRYVSSTWPTCHDPAQPAGPGSVKCALPSGFQTYSGDFHARATSTGTKTFKLTGRAANSPDDTGTSDVPVGP